MLQNEINDKRKQKDFKNITFSKFKKSDAKKQLLQSLLASKVEDSCYWSAELICSGYFLYLWEIIFYFMGKHIHIGNPRLPLYINMRLDNFKDIINSGYTSNLLKLRNNEKIRKLFGEIMCVLCYSKKKNSYDIPKITDKEFNFINLTERLVAKNKNLGLAAFQNDDPNEIFVAINEFAWNIHYSNRDYFKANYWIEWILEYHKICKKNKLVKECACRTGAVDTKFQKEMIWIVWDCIKREADRRKNSNLVKVIDGLENLFSLKYKSSTKNKRKLLIYNAVALLCESYNINSVIIANKKKVENLKSKIDIIYGQIKKNEEKPKTDYLFNNSMTNNEKNLEKTMNKLNKMDNLLFIPRN